MARRVFYRVVDDGENFISGEEWEEIHSLERWYNLEFFWTGGKLNFKRYIIFPNYELAGTAPGKSPGRIFTIREDWVCGRRNRQQA